MSKNTTMDPSDNGGEIIDEPMNEALSKRYLAYALSTITPRALSWSGRWSLARTSQSARRR